MSISSDFLFYSLLRANVNGSYDTSSLSINQSINQVLFQTENVHST